MNGGNPGSITLHLTLATVAIIFGSGSIAINSMNWFYLQQSLARAGEAGLGLSLDFYYAEFLGIVSLAIGVYLFYRLMLAGAGRGEVSVGLALSRAVASRRDVRIGAIAALGYAFVYAVASGTLVYQPAVGSGASGWSTGALWGAAVCCGAPGTVPSIVVYLSSQYHLALQLIPLNALFVVIIPILVGFNVTVAAYALRSGAGLGARWFGSVGIIAGLFTGCPTCAGLLIASAVGGVGATTLAVVLSPYQILFIALSIPLLIASPLVIAESFKRSCSASCPRPFGNEGARVGPEG